MLILKVEVSGGTDIQEAIRDARRISEQLGVMIEFNFNGIEMCISHQESDYLILMQYRKALDLSLKGKEG